MGGSDVGERSRGGGERGDRRREAGARRERRGEPHGGRARASEGARVEEATAAIAASAVRTRRLVEAATTVAP